MNAPEDFHQVHFAEQRIHEIEELVARVRIAGAAVFEHGERVGKLSGQFERVLLRRCLEFAAERFLYACIHADFIGPWEAPRTARGHKCM